MQSYVVADPPRETFAVHILWHPDKYWIPKRITVEATSDMREWQNKRSARIIFEGKYRAYEYACRYIRELQEFDFSETVNLV
jgi:hypothetical protein